MKTHVIASLKKVVSIVALNLFVASGAFAATTLLNFEAPTVEPGQLTNQYDSQGVNFLGTQVGTGDELQVVPKSGNQIAYSQGGKITANFSSSIGSVQSVSVYVSSTVNIGLYAYSSSGALLSQATAMAISNNTLISVSSPTPIAYVEIHDHGSEFAIDDLSFVTAATIPVCEAVNQNLYNYFKAVPDSLYKVPKTASITRAAGLKLILAFDAALKSDVSNKVLLAQLAIIRAGVDCALKSSPQKTQVLKLIDELIAKTKAGQC